MNWTLKIGATQSGGTSRGATPAIGDHAAAAREVVAELHAVAGVVSER